MFDVADGMVSVPNGVGLGVEIDEDLVRKAALNAPSWRNPVSLVFSLDHAFHFFVQQNRCGEGLMERSESGELGQGLSEGSE